VGNAATAAMNEKSIDRIMMDVISVSGLYIEKSMYE
jgi:hypothetical protein